MATLTSFPVETKTLSELTTATALEDTDLIHLDQGGIDKHITGQVSKQGHGGIIPWTSGFSYLEGGYCDRNGVLYRAKQAHSGQDPELDITNTYWEYAKITPTKIVTGAATFNNSTNNIALTGIGIIDGLETGDVIQVTSTTNNNAEFTVDVITDNDNVVVNEEHAGGTTTKSLVDETAACTVLLLSKWYEAPLGLGQGRVNMARSSGVVHTNNSKRVRPVQVSSSIAGGAAQTTGLLLEIDGVIVERTRQTITSNEQGTSISFDVLPSETYEVTTLGSDSIDYWFEIL